MKTTLKPTIYVDSFELSRYLTEKFGRYVEFIDSNNDTSYEVTISPVTEFDEWDQKYIAEFLKLGQISFELGHRTVLNYACGLGHLDPGDYVIRVSW